MSTCEIFIILYSIIRELDDVDGLINDTGQMGKHDIVCKIRKTLWEEKYDEKSSASIQLELWNYPISTSEQYSLKPQSGFRFFSFFI